MDIFERFRIPTLLGLFVLVSGLGAGVYLTMQNQIFISKAAPEATPKNIVVSNLGASEASISWQTDTATTGFVTYGISAPSQTVLDDRDISAPVAKATHHVTLTNLSPETTYKFKVFSGKTSSNPEEFTTTKASTSNTLKPIIGSVLDKDKPLSGGLVFLQINGIPIQSTVIKASGNFIIPLSSVSPTPTIGTLGNLLVFTEDGRKANATITINDTGLPIGTLKVGENLDLTGSSLGVSTSADTNKDGVINSLDVIKKAPHK